jgi:radical SAM superfamily enzyme YgiQ (UPF0313 family)
MKGLIFSNSLWSRNLGAYRIAHMLREHGWDIEVIDWFSWWQPDEITTLLQQRIDSNTKFIGYGSLFFNENTVPYWFFNYIKKNYPDIVTIFGTQVNTNIDHENINYTVSGWADHSILVLLKYLFSNGELPVFTKKQKTKNINSTHSYPAFLMESLIVEYEHRDYIEPYESLTVEWSRGCKFKCKFCNFPVLGVKDDYSRTANDFKHQLLESYNKFGVTKYILADETCNDSLAKIIKYADVVEQLPFQTAFSGFMRADLLIHHKEQRKHLARMNFHSHYYGIESLNYESAKSIGKGMCSEKIKDGLLEIESYFESQNKGYYRGSIGLIIGLPYETEETIESGLTWLKKYWYRQSFNTYVLEIPVSDIDTKSMFSLDYKKYGYEEYKNLTDDDQKLINDFYQIDTNPARKAVRVAIKTLIWKNKNLDFVKAIQLDHRIKKLYPEFKFNSFALFDQKTLDFNATFSNSNFYALTLVKSYKQKKLMPV